MGIRSQRRMLALMGGLLCICLAVSPAAAGQATSLTIEQAWNQGNEVLVFFSAADLEGKPVSGLEPEDLQARIGGVETPVIRLEPFNHQSEGIAWVVLVDTSRSLDPQQFADLQAAVHNLMRQMGQHDRMALMTFGAEVRVACDYTDDQAVLGASLDALAANDDQTRMYQGLLQALDTARRQDSALPERRVIVLLSDGGEDYYGGASKDEVISSLKIEPVPVYTLGIYNERIDSDAALEAMGEISRASGGQAWQYEASALSYGVDALMQELLARYVLRLQSGQCPQDGKDYRLILALQQDWVRVEDGVALYMAAVPTEAAEKTADAADSADADNSTYSWENITNIASWPGPADWPLWVLGIAGGLVLILICFIIMMIARKRKRSAPGGAVNQIYPDNENTRDYDALVLPAIGPYDSTHQDGFPGGMAMGTGLNGGLSASDHSESPGRVAAASWQPPAAGFPASQPREATAFRHSEPDRARTIVLNMLGKGPGERSFQLLISESGKASTIGRTTDNDLVISDDDRVSARHCQFIFDNGRIYVEDLESTNGTLVNGVPIAGRYALEQDDLILIGKTELRYALIQDNGGPER